MEDSSSFKTSISFDSSVSVDKFWSDILRRDKNNFPDLAKFALDILSLPHSNAQWERGFSKLNLFKTKTRSRLNIDTINSALLTSDGTKRQNSCIQFKPSKEMVAQINNSQVLMKMWKMISSKTSDFLFFCFLQLNYCVCTAWLSIFVLFSVHLLNIFLPSVWRLHQWLSSFILFNVHEHFPSRCVKN